jgi:pyridoxamine 5'-phosphate oxidase
MSEAADMIQIGKKAPLQPGGMDPDPFRQFANWFQDAEQAELPLPNAMTLATSNRQGKPSARMVLLKGVDERGFAFFTNQESRKAQELLENPFAALVFCWLPLSRQVRIEGVVETLGGSEADAYFASRPRGHQIEAHASPQSRVIKDRLFLEKQFADVARTFEGQGVPRPLHWGGYRVVPEQLEFWQEGQHRLHDRLRYRRDHADNWVIERLAP